jgi:hypothetical protein
VIETPRYDLTLFKLHFGRLTLRRLTLKGYTKGERVLRFEAIVHNTKELSLGRAVAPASACKPSSTTSPSLSAQPWRRPPHHARTSSGLTNVGISELGFCA